MNPIVPFIMAIGAILFFIGISVLVRRGFKNAVTVKFLRREYGYGRFAFTTIISGIVFIMVSIYIQKLFPVEINQEEIKTPNVVLSSNLKYELESILPHDKDNTKLMDAINRFQKEYQLALEKGDKNTMELLILEMAFIVRTELENINYPSHQIGSEVERIMRFLKQKPD